MSFFTACDIKGNEQGKITIFFLKKKRKEDIFSKSKYETSAYLVAIFYYSWTKPVL